MTLDIRIREDTDDLDLSEKGRAESGETISLDRRLYMQFLAYGDCRAVAPLIETLELADIAGVVYADLNDPQGIGLLTFNENPNYFLDTLRPILNSGPFLSPTPKPEYTMFGRTYSIGYEADLEETLIRRPRHRVCDPAWPWAIWYPLRRSGEFEQLSAEEKRVILMEHGGIGRSYGRAGKARDIRLACHGLDKNDNDFVIGLLGRELHPLSTIVQRMRKTKQTSLYLERLGPFFVGRAVRQRC